jgi:hypothetical protein
MRRYTSPTLRQKRARIPKLPGTADKGAPLPEVDWNNRFTMVRVGTNPDGTPIIEAQPKPRPLS